MTDALKLLLTDDAELGRQAALAILAADVSFAAAIYAIRHQVEAARA